MQKFIKNILLFFAPITLLFAILLAILNGFIKYDKERSTLRQGVNKIFIGDSHIQNAVNDSLLKHTQNIALASEGLDYSYYKIKYLTKHNPKIDTIFLGASYHSFSDYYDEISYKEHVASRYFFYMPIDNQLNIFLKIENPINFITRKILYELSYSFGKSKENNLLGFFTNHVTKTKISIVSILNRIQFQYFLNGKERNFSKKNLNYLRKIVKHCKSSNIHLILINTPLHIKYTENVPEKFKNEFYSLIDDCNTELLEFDSSNFEDDDFLPDGDHLSMKGAIKTTKRIKIKLESTSN